MFVYFSSEHNSQTMNNYFITLFKFFFALRGIWTWTPFPYVRHCMYIYLVLYYNFRVKFVEKITNIERLI